MEEPRSNIPGDVMLTVTAGQSVNGGVSVTDADDDPNAPVPAAKTTVRSSRSFWPEIAIGGDPRINV